MMLFLNILADSMGLALNANNIGVAAKLTFGNVLLITFLFGAADYIRRKITVDRPVKQITEAAEKIMQGDFSARVPPIHGAGTDGFNQIGSAINAMAEELSGTETLRTDFIANVSHELKTPLAVMGNYATMLQHPGITEEEKNEYAKAISEAARRLAQLITNILKLNKLENQQIFPQRSEFDLGEQLCESLLQFEDAWEAKHLNIETDMEEGIYIKSDPELLRLVWNNLISNAVKFTPDGGTVGVSLKTNGSSVIVQVRDTGCGMKPEVGQHIFEKFYQGDTSHATQGNGLGLALVKRVVDILGGEIGVQSVCGEGSTFTVKFKR
ncbi:MAG: HAMP domain-containing histidine kinase [Oscillospiraceae bacterium]|nr:HAMP domain-containing histidine kinase [Oscillospiraceae bacterium]